MYQLKLKASRAFYSEVEKKFGSMPFTLRSCEDEKKAKMGVVESVNHKLIEPFNVLYEKDSEIVAQFKFTLLLLPSGGHRITGLPFDFDLYQSDLKIEDETILSLLTRSACPKPKKKSKSKSTKSGGTSVGDVTPDPSPDVSSTNTSTTTVSSENTNTTGNTNSTATTADPSLPKKSSDSVSGGKKTPTKVSGDKTQKTSSSSAEKKSSAKKK